MTKSIRYDRVSIRVLKFLKGVFSELRRVWRVLLPLAGRVVDAYHFGLITSRYRMRKLIFRRQNSFPDLEPADVRVVVVNLHKRPDRLKDVLADLKRVGFVDVRVLTAVDGPEKYPLIARGHASNLGCAESHMKAVQENLHSRRPIAVCEDDNQFLEEPERLFHLIGAFLRSNHFDVLCLASRARGPRVVVSEDFQIVGWALAPSFYVVKPNSMDPLLRAFAKSIRLLRAEKRRGPFDQVWRSTQRYSLLFVRPNSKVARQKESYSDIQEQFFRGT